MFEDYDYDDFAYDDPDDIQIETDDLVSDLDSEDRYLENYIDGIYDD